MADAQSNGFSSPTLSRLLIGAMGVLLFSALSFFGYTISSSISRIELNTDKQITKIEIALLALRDAEVSNSDRYMTKLVDLQMELKVAQMQIKQLESAAEKSGHSLESPRK